MLTGKNIHINKHLLPVVLLLLTSCQVCRLQPGDLLFHVAPNGNEITAVTEGMVDHVAIVLNKDSVIEAVERGVVTTPIDSLRHQSGYYLHARVRNHEGEELDAAASLANARGYLGRAYDHLYLPDNEPIYCSELVQFSFVNRKGQRLFEPIPMSFHDSSGTITTYWMEFYARHHMEVPEGKAGTNPNELSRRKNIRILGNLKELK